MQNFAHWLSGLLGQSELDINRLLSDETAAQFLLAWSLFESKCFRSDLKAASLPAFAEELANSTNYSPQSLEAPARHFHARYQDRSKVRRLMPKDRTPNWMLVAFNNLLGASYDRLTPRQIVELVVFVVYRFRNNMFHGAKGVSSWLRYREQIRLCVDALQVFVSHAETKRPTMGVQAAK